MGTFGVWDHVGPSRTRQRPLWQFKDSFSVRGFHRDPTVLMLSFRMEDQITKRLPYSQRSTRCDARILCKLCGTNQRPALARNWNRHCLRQHQEFLLFRAKEVRNLIYIIVYSVGHK